MDAVVHYVGSGRVRPQIPEDGIPDILGDTDDPCGPGPDIRHEKIPDLYLLFRKKLGIILVLHVVYHGYHGDARLRICGSRKGTEEKIHTPG